MPDPDLHQRARDLLAKLSIVAEGKVSYQDPIAQAETPVASTPGLRTRIAQPTPPAGGHQSGGSRAPVNLERIDDGNVPRSRFDYWLNRFSATWWNDEKLLYEVTKAEDELERVQRTPLPTGDLPSGSKLTERILATRGPAAEVAAKFARFGVTIANVKKERFEHAHDPETGIPWPVNRERAMELALALAAERPRPSYRRIREITGVPTMTLHDNVHRSPPGGVLSRTPVADGRVTSAGD